MRVLIFGASARAAAQSARRCGYQVYAADLFADRDLQDIATCFQVTDYPRGFSSIRQRLRDLPLIYTGALENYPAAIDLFAKSGLLLGNDGATLRAVRDPFELARVFAKHKVAFPTTTATPPCPDKTNNWLVKALNSAGGNHVEHWTEHASRPAQRHVFQQRLHGPPCSAAFVVSSGERQVRFLGATRMLVGHEWGAANEFAYCGSVAVDAQLTSVDEWTRIGQALCAEFNLTGVFGIDAIETPSGIVPIEVNPRYTASMEVIEPSLREPVMAYHVAACRGESIQQQLHGLHRPMAKLIVYAKQPYAVPEILPGNFPGVQRADLPLAGQTIMPGQPILTLLADSVARLKEAGKHWEQPISM